MERLLSDELSRWSARSHRKPLIIKGQRQVGKTWLLKEFGARTFSNVAYLNFDEDPTLGGIFESTKNTTRILDHLSLVGGSPILPGKTLLILDEIQESNAALNSLKYFCENAPEYHVVCAGSLLGVTLSRPSSFPVGKVDFLTLRPMTFSEFLRASGDDALLDHLQRISSLSPLPNAIAQPLTERLSRYLVIGGMPEAVRLWVTDHDMEAVAAAQRAILDSCELDFAKHAPARDIARIGYIWRSIPSQLARENKKFLYKAAREGTRARDYESALHWLTEMGIVTRVHSNTAPRLPLSAYDNLSAFKIYSTDSGMLARQSGLDASTLGDPIAPFTEFKGALAENFVLQSLVAQFETVPRYWKSGGEAEVEFLLQRGGDIHPIEVKSGTSTRSKSLSVYRKMFKPRLALRLSLKNLELRDGLLNVPLYMIDQLDRLIALALERVSS